MQLGQTEKPFNAYVPALQRAQEQLPLMLLYLPDGQFEQEAEFEPEILPLGQVEHEIEPALEYLPQGQLEQDVLEE